MAEDAWRSTEPLPAEGERPMEAGKKPGLGIVLAAILAGLASAALAWWFATPDATRTLNAPPERVAAAPALPAATPAPAKAPLRYAPDEPDPGQVKQAWRETQAGYVNGGPEALVRGSMNCAKVLPADPRRLDYCVAYDIYASEIAAGDAGADWFHDTAQRDLALARMALPETADPSNRIAQLTALTKAVIPKPAVRRAKAAQTPAAKPVHKAAVRKAAVRQAVAKPLHTPVRHRRHVHKRRPRNFPAAIYPYTALPDPPPPDYASEPPH